MNGDFAEIEPSKLERYDIPDSWVAQIDNSDSAIRLTVPSLEAKISELCAAIDRLVKALESKP